MVIFLFLAFISVWVSALLILIQGEVITTKKIKMEKQTAVEFLYKSLEHIRIDRNAKRISAEQAMNSRAEVLESAKELEKQQIIDAYDNGNYAYGMGIKEPEQYYNETFKNK